MIDFLSMPLSGVFLASIGVTILLCLVEGLALAFAGTMTPSFMDFDGGEGDADAHGGGVLGYLNAGHVPLTLFVASAAAVFGVTGLGVQQVATSVLGQPLALTWAIPIAALAAVPGTHFVTKTLGAMLPKTETTAISNQDLIGREGEVMAGTGVRGTPVQVKLRDEFGQAHYLMVEPTRDDDTLTQGEKVTLTTRDGPLYFAIASANQLIQESKNNGK
jgi:membrane protein implicated in regulation of membrane protease activity